MSTFSSEQIRQRQESLAKLFNDQLNIDKSVEESKKKIFQRDDFNVDTAFMFFTEGKTNTISLYEIKFGDRKSVV